MDVNISIVTTILSVDCDNYSVCSVQMIRTVGEEDQTRNHSIYMYF